MIGIELCTLTRELHKVTRQHNKKPVGAIKDLDTKLGRWKEYWIGFEHKDALFPTHCYELPLRAFKNFTFDELCKIRYSSSFGMDREVEELFKNETNYEVVNKIANSMWQWGRSKGTWNELVDTYDHLRHFSFPGGTHFEVRLDFTTYSNPYGASKFNRTFLDGVFALLVYYRGEHVMTIGFSVIEKKGLLIQQVQLVKRKGNRWLFQLPANRLEFVIGLFQSNFPHYRIAVIDGKSLVEKTLADYGCGFDSAAEDCEHNHARLHGVPAQEQTAILHDLKEAEDERDSLQQKMDHLCADAPRLIAFYKNAGKFTLGPEFLELNGLSHNWVTT